MNDLHRRPILDLYKAISDKLQAKRDELRAQTDSCRTANDAAGQVISLARRETLLDAMNIVLSEFEKTE